MDPVIAVALVALAICIGIFVRQALAARCPVCGKWMREARRWCPRCGTELG